MAKTVTERGRDFRDRQKKLKAGLIPVNFWITPEDARLMRHSIRRSINLLKYKPADNLIGIMAELKEIEQS